MLCHTWSICIFVTVTSLSVFRSHMKSKANFAYYFWSKRDRPLQVTWKCLPRRDTSTDVQHDVVGSPWPENKFWPWTIKVNVYMLWRVSTKAARRSLNCSRFLCSNIIREKPFRWKPANVNFRDPRTPKLLKEAQRNSYWTKDSFILMSYHWPSPWVNQN